MTDTNEIQEKLEAQLHPLAGPFLFVGAGLSRRYVNLPNWEGLLRNFTKATPHPYEYYRGLANSDLPATASMIAADFYDLWWSDPAYADSVDAHGSDVTDGSSALKYEIAEYVTRVVEDSEVPAELAAEWDLLTEATIDGIITTNFDPLLRRAFPEFKVYVGQGDLLFANTTGIGETFMIHGSATDPQSLILTKDDYDGYQKRYAYLAAKLLTIFAEHPIVFLGYSLTDPNIQAILQSLVSGLDRANVDKLQQRLIFVEWQASGDPSITDTVYPVGDATLPITRVLTSDFTPVFRALASRKRAIPANVLRLLQQQIYDLVLTHDPEERLVAYTDIDSETAKDVDVVFGVGAKVASVGIVGLTRRQVLNDVLEHPSLSLDPKDMVDQFYDRIPSNWWVPGFKYLAGAGHLTKDGHLKEKTKVKTHVRARVDTAVSKISEACAHITEAPTSMTELRAAHDTRWILVNAFKLPVLTNDLEGLRTFLVEIADGEELHAPWSSFFGRAVLAYDYMKYGPGRSAAPTPSP